MEKPGEKQGIDTKTKELDMGRGRFQRDVSSDVGETDPSWNENPKNKERRLKFLTLPLQYFCVLQLLTGIAFVVVACLIIFPPLESAIVILLWIIGVFTILAAVMGFVAASPSRIRCCLGPYMTMAGNFFFGTFIKIKDGI